MAQFTEDWTDLDNIPWSWDANIREGNFYYPLYNDNGIYHGDLSISPAAITESSSDLSYTGSISFYIGTLGTKPLTTIGMNYMTQKKITFYNKIIFLDSTSFYFDLAIYNQHLLGTSLTAGGSGSIVVTVGTTDDIGTETVTFYYNGTNYGSVVKTDVDLTGTDSIHRFSNYNFNFQYATYDYLYITTTAFMATPSNVAPVGDTYLTYYGSYNNGSTYGLSNLSSRVLSISPIQSSLYIKNYTGMSSEVSVLLDNASNQWGAFSGYSTSGTIYNPPGYFTVYDPYIMGGDQPLFYGYADYNTLKFDNKNKTVELKLESVLAKILDKPLIPIDELGSASEYLTSVDRGLWNISLFGTVSSIINTDSDVGTIIVKHSSFMPALQSGDLIGKVGEKVSCNVESFVDYNRTDGTYYGTYTIKNKPSWITVASLLACNYSTLGTNYPIDIYLNDLLIRNSMLYYIGKLLGYTAEELLNLFFEYYNQYFNYLPTFYVSPTIRYNGNESIGKVLDDISESFGGFYSSKIDNLLLPIYMFIPSYNSNTFVAAGTLNYNTDIYESDSYLQKHRTKQTILNYNYYELENKFKSHTIYDLYDDEEGETLTINNKFIYNPVDAAIIGFFTGEFFKYNVDIDIVVDARFYEITIPGSIIYISNIPAGFQIPTDYFTVISRTFNPQNKMLYLKLMGVPSLFYTNYFKIDYDAIGGTEVVL